MITKKTVALFLLIATLAIYSCNKEENIIGEEDINNITNTDELFKTLDEQDKIVSITENYFHKELGIKGTLYVVENLDGSSQEWLKAAVLILTVSMLKSG